MVHLSRPHRRFQDSFLAATDEFVAAGEEQHGGLLSMPADDHFAGVEFTRQNLADPSGFDRFVAHRLDDELPDTPRPTGWVPCTFLWMSDGPGSDQFLGSIALRHSIDHPFLAEAGGHIGYSVRPSARRRGHATDALRQVVALAGRRGIGRVLVTCDETNVASARTIEAGGGVFEDSRQEKRRYWIPTGG